jgi:NAD+ diphosphatase
VTLILSSRPNVYAGSPLDRAAHLRDDAAWVEAALVAPDSLFVPVWRARSLVRGVDAGQPEAVFVTAEAAAALRQDADPHANPWSFLGLYRGTPLFAIDLSTDDEPLPRLPPDLGAFADLRSVGPLLPAGEASILAHARGLMHWRVKHRFCGICGARCVALSAGHVMLCTGCNTQHFPRTDPAVIMLVHRGDNVLLGHSQRFPMARMYSTLAGFVEPGESLEEAVAREVLEESGITVGAVQYHSSQPWPFPANIMLGFYAEALSEEIVIDPNELRDARWFSRADIRAHRELDFNLPGPASIARRLIEDWMALA